MTHHVAHADQLLHHTPSSLTRYLPIWPVAPKTVTVAPSTEQRPPRPACTSGCVKPRARLMVAWC